MKKDITTLGALLLTAALLFGTTLLLDWDWVARRIARQIIVYLIMALVLYVAAKWVLDRYKQKPNQN